MFLIELAYCATPPWLQVVMPPARGRLVCFQGVLDPYREILTTMNSVFKPTPTSVGNQHNLTFTDPNI